MKRAKIGRTSQEFERAIAKPKTKVAARYALRLFISGSTPRSTRAIQTIRSICEQDLNGNYDLEVIDIYQHPEQVRPDQIVVTPTLVKTLPLPLRKIIGDLSDKERVLVGLGLLKQPGDRYGT